MYDWQIGIETSFKLCRLSDCHHIRISTSKVQVAPCEHKLYNNLLIDIDDEYIVDVSVFFLFVVYILG